MVAIQDFDTEQKETPWRRGGNIGMRQAISPDSVYIDAAENGRQIIIANPQSQTVRID
jgi:hypothetical protein